MSIEKEAKILNINTGKVRHTLRRLGATHIGSYNFRRYVFDTIPAKKSSWLRLRTNGEIATLAFKKIVDKSIDGTHEWEVEVSDFDTTLAILQGAGLLSKGYQENKREEYEIEGAYISIDTWPLLNPYIEIEAKSSTHVVELAGRMGFSGHDLVSLNTIELYKNIGIDLNRVDSLTFEGENVHNAEK